MSMSCHCATCITDKQHAHASQPFEQNTRDSTTTRVIERLTMVLLSVCRSSQRLERENMDKSMED